MGWNLWHNHEKLLLTKTAAGLLKCVGTRLRLGPDRYMRHSAVPRRTCLCLSMAVIWQVVYIMRCSNGIGRWTLSYLWRNVYPRWCLFYCNITCFEKGHINVPKCRLKMVYSCFLQQLTDKTLICLNVLVFFSQ